jgi:hypothetical protein
VTERVWWAALCLICFVGVVLATLRGPGTWLILISAILYSWTHDWLKPTTTILLTLFAIAVLAEMTEFLAGMITARRSGASRRAAWGALIGGFAGMLLLALPVPIAGPILGGFLGCFLGAAIGELTLERGLRHGARVGTMAAIGQAIGMAAKSGLALVMAGATLYKTW